MRVQEVLIQSIQELGYADELQVGDKLQKADGINLTIDKVEFVKLDKPVTVYNFTVADFHTYYVTDLGVWVHNTDGCLRHEAKYLGLGKHAPGSTSVVHMPDGTTVPATKMWLRNNGTGTFHGYPAP